jgi:hypothetical protein
MEDNDDIRPVSKVRILSNDSAQVTDVTDALYSSPFLNSTDSGDAPQLKPQFQNSELPEATKKKDTVSTGTFGNLVRKVNQNGSMEERVAKARQRIRFNLLKVGPRRNTTDECEAWRKYLF